MYCEIVKSPSKESPSIRREYSTSYEDIFKWGESILKDRLEYRQTEIVWTRGVLHPYPHLKSGVAIKYLMKVGNNVIFTYIRSRIYIIMKPSRTTSLISCCLVMQVKCHLDDSLITSLCLKNHSLVQGLVWGVGRSHLDHEHSYTIYRLWFATR